MKITNSNSEAKRELFSELYENAKAALSDVFADFEKHMAQYRGSDEIDGSAERASTVRNITYEIVESQVSSDIPFPKVDPSYHNERREKNAVAAEKLAAVLRDRLPFEALNDIDERYTYIYGGSVWYVEWDNSIRVGSEIGGVRIHCLSPTSFIPQPGICNVADMEYCFLKFTTTRGELTRKYGVSDEAAVLAEADFSFGEDDSFGDTVNVIVCFYKNELGEIGQFIFSGELTLSDVESYYRRKRTVCKRCSCDAEKCLCAAPLFESEDMKYEYISAAELPSDDERFSGVDGGISVPYYLPTSFPIVIRRNTSTEGLLYGQSDCAYIRPEQQAINKIESRILQKLLRAGVTPVMPEDASVTLNNSVFGQVIRMKPGESAEQYGKVDTTPDVSQDMKEAERLYDHAKRVLGISDAFQGIDMNGNESGYAKQLRISQATGRLESKRKMKYTAYTEIDRIIFEHYLAFADEARLLYYKDEYGRVRESEFRRTDFIEYDSKSGRYYYDDSYLFSVDLNGGSEYQREALWQRNLENLNAGTLGDKSELATLLRYWQCQERAHYPHARENVEYFRAAIDELQKEKRKKEKEERKQKK